jgi:predicted lipoprotein with Yx(FWY)xxD motif
MRRALIFLSTAAATAILAACGSSGSNGSGGSGGSGGSSGPAAGGAASTVAVEQVDGVGAVLVDSSGRALYSPDEEATGQILCTGACTSFWMPLAAAGTPTAAAGGPQLAVIDRPDGTKQVTADGRPLYTFAEDSPGQVKGNGFSDAFGSQHFTWHAILAGGTTASGTPGADTNSGGGTGYGY